MADKKVDATTGEIKEEKKYQYFDRSENSLEDEGPEKGIFAGKWYSVHCKPVYNYQSVEFDFLVQEESDIAEMEQLYSKMLEMLVRVSQNAPQKDVSKPVAPVEEPASEKQKEILRNFHIDFKPDITKKQAHALIKKSMDQDIY